MRSNEHHGRLAARSSITPPGCRRIVTLQGFGPTGSCPPPHREAVWYNKGYYPPGIPIGMHGGLYYHQPDHELQTY
jgi:hypothetical protein